MHPNTRDKHQSKQIGAGRFSTKLEQPFRYAGLLVILAISCFLAACGSVGDGAPKGSVTSTEGTAVLTWDAVSDSNLSGYRIYYGTAPGSYFQSFGHGLDVKNATSYSMTGLETGTIYYFAVTSVDTSNGESGYSNESSKTIP